MTIFAFVWPKARPLESTTAQLELRQKALAPNSSGNAGGSSNAFPHRPRQADNSMDRGKGGCLDPGPQATRVVYWKQGGEIRFLEKLQAMAAMELTMRGTK